MAKRLKVRICRAIATTLQSCRSKDPSVLPQDPVPSFPQISTIHFPHAPPLHFKWQTEAKWHVVANIHNPDPPRRRLKKKKKKKNIPARIRLSTSSADSGWFSSDGGEQQQEEETETLVSTSPNSSSEFNHLHSIKEAQPWPHRRAKKRTSHRKRGVVRPAATDGETPARLSMFKKLIPCTVDGKVKESFAIVKKSENPYEDFKSSMMDMILEKQMFEQKDLEQLLQCFLSLNSRHYHGIIVDAFSEIWEDIFSPEHHRRTVSKLASSS